MCVFRVSPVCTVKMSYVVERDGTFYFQLKVPVDLQAAHGSRLIKRSLRTKDPQEAVRRAERMYADTQRLFAAMRSDEGYAGAVLEHAAETLARRFGWNQGLLTEHLHGKMQAWASQKAAGDFQQAELLYAEHAEEVAISEVDRLAFEMVRKGRPRGEPSEAPKPPKGFHLTDALDLYLKVHKRGADAAFAEHQRGSLKLLTDFVGDLEVRSLRREHARAFVQKELDRGVSTSSVRRRINDIKAIINSGLREAELTKEVANPFERLQIPGEGADKKARAIPTDEAMREIHRAMVQDDSDTARLIVLQMHTGARIGELAKLAGADIFVNDPTVPPHLWIRPNGFRKQLKNDNSIRKVALVGDAVTVAKLLRARTAADEPVFPQYATERGGDSASAAVNKRLERWGVTSHGFRHKMKDWLRDAEVPKDLRDPIQGHAAPDVSERYGDRYALRRMVRALVKALKPLTAEADKPAEHGI